VTGAVFVLVRYVNRLREPETAPEPAAPTVKKCPYCASDVPVAATRCPHCTSDLPAESASEEVAA
jgi:large conductance mechanosensitive channel